MEIVFLRNSTLFEPTSCFFQEDDDSLLSINIFNSNFNYNLIPSLP